jgi:dTDP-3-amino-3,4,6-trideoxy-alpha-D-glucose transaminase
VTERVIQVADPHASLAGSRGSLVAAFETVLDSGRYILDRQVTAFEREWAQRCEVAHAVGVSSGTDALALALRAAGVGAGDEVLVPAMTAVATWMAVRQIGALPVGVDIEPLRNGMDPARARAALTPRTKALVAVHLFGMPADVSTLAEIAAEAGILLIEDAAQAHGARLHGRAAGSFGALAAFSFYPTKNLGAMGDAGAVTTANAELADRVRMLREYGWRTRRRDAELDGVNARLDELQAALLRVLLDRLQPGNERRAAIAQSYLEGLADTPALELPANFADSEPAWHQFVVRHDSRDALAANLERVGVGTAVHYATLPPHNTAFLARGLPAGPFPVAEAHAARALSLPIHPGLSDADVERVVTAVAASAR